MHHDPTPSKRTRRLWTAGGTVVFLATVAASTYAGKTASSSASAALLQSLVLFLGTAATAGWMSRLVPAHRAQYLAGMTLFGATPLAGVVLFPASEFWQEFARSNGWIFSWFPLYVGSVGYRSRAACAFGTDRAVVFLLIAGPLVTGAALLLSAALP